MVGGLADTKWSVEGHYPSRYTEEDNKATGGLDDPNGGWLRFVLLGNEITGSRYFELTHPRLDYPWQSTDVSPNFLVLTNLSKSSAGSAISRS